MTNRLPRRQLAGMGRCGVAGRRDELEPPTGRAGTSLWVESAGGKRSRIVDGGFDWYCAR
jgi:hypothetical protein